MNKKELLRTLKYSLRFLPDELYCKIYYRHNLKKGLDLKNPKTFNEKINWIKLNDHNPLYTMIADKYGNREYVASKIGEEYLIPLLGVWDQFTQIDFDKLPKQFVLKCNHDSGGIVVIKDKFNLNIQKAKACIEKSLNSNFYYVAREWQYKNIDKKIIAEKYLEDSHQELNDYKIYCFNGRPYCTMICKERSSGKPKYYFYDNDWNFLPYDKTTKNASAKELDPVPVNFDQMLEIASKLSEDFYFARIDLYNVDGRIYFGEITLTPNSGFDRDLTIEAEKDLGEKLILPKS